MMTGSCTFAMSVGSFSTDVARSSRIVSWRIRTSQDQLAMYSVSEYKAAVRLGPSRLLRDLYIRFPDCFLPNLYELHLTVFVACQPFTFPFSSTSPPVFLFIMTSCSGTLYATTCPRGDLDRPDCSRICTYRCYV